MRPSQETDHDDASGPIGDVLIVGASLAGGRAAEALRKGGFEGRVVVVGDEPWRPYDRPPLSKKLLRGQVEEGALFHRSAEWYDERRIELVLGSPARALHTSARELELASGRRLAFSRLLIATGARVRRLRCPGSGKAGVHYVRTLDDVRALRAELGGGARVCVIGAGVIGAEVAASCRELGHQVSVVELEPIPLVRAFGADVGGLYADIHRDKGVALYLGARVSELCGGARVEQVVLEDGRRIACDVVVVGIGVEPCTEWLSGSGVAHDDGVLVDARGRTSVAGIYAGGDVAKLFHPSEGRHVRLESVDNAQLGGAAAVSNMLGKAVTYDPVPYFWSDQYELKLQSVGWLHDYDEVVYRGDVSGRSFAAFHLKAGALRGFVGVNRMQEMMGAKRLIAAGARPSREALADPTVTMGSLLPKASPEP
jgi:3-phenylpropionate/trans-cinnamate dioxygenase ferredoxin reductase subunit